MSQWVSTADIKTMLGISGSAQDAKIALLAPQAQALIERAIGRTLEQATYTETYDGRGAPTLILKHRPVASITSIKDSLSRDWAGTTAMDSSGYAFQADEGIVTLDPGASDWPEDWPLAGRFSDGNQNVQVVYVAGYLAASIPADILGLVVDLVAAKLNAGAKAGLKSESLGDYSYTLADLDSLSPTSKATIAAWRDGSGSR